MCLPACGLPAAARPASCTLRCTAAACRPAAITHLQYGWGPDVYLRYSTLSKLFISPPDTDVGVEPVGAAQTFYAPPSPPAGPPPPPPM